jgi:hypothetical protein
MPKIAAQPPLINQPPANFYQAQGGAVKLRWSLDRTRVAEDGELTATLVITGATNPREIVRPDLKKLPDFQSRFVIADNADTVPDPHATEVKFSYRLRPRNRSVEKVPTLDFHFYNPSASAGKKQFPLATARAIPITVTEAPKAEPPAIPLTEPAELFVARTGPQVLKKAPYVPELGIWLLVGLGGPVCALAWFVAWRQLFPDGRRLAGLRRSRGARLAHDAIARADRAPDPASALAAAMLGYLRSRFPIPAGAVTPNEVEFALTELAVPESNCTAVGLFLRCCDAARFAPIHDKQISLAASAASLINRLEDA